MNFFKKSVFSNSIYEIYIGYWPSVGSSWRDISEVHQHAKKEQGDYPSILTEQVWSMKDLLYNSKGTIKRQ